MIQGRGFDPRRYRKTPLRRSFVLAVEAHGRLHQPYHQRPSHYGAPERARPEVPAVRGPLMVASGSDGLQKPLQIAIFPSP